MSIWTGLTIPPAAVLNATAGPASWRGLAQAADGQVVPLTYGEDRVVGRILNVLPSAINPKLLLVQVLWGWGCDSVADLRLADQALPAGSSATHYTGAQTSPDPQIVAAMLAQGISSVPSLFGFAYSVVALPIKSVNGRLNISARVRGRRVYDPRQDGSRPGGSGPQRLADPATWAWSDCPALALADWTASTAYGAGLAVDWASVATVAAANDALVGGERRRVLGLTLREPAEIRALAETLRAYAGCWTLPSAAGVKLLADGPDAPSASYSHAAGEILALAPLELRDTSRAPTAVEVIYTDTRAIPWRDGSAIASLPGAGSTKPWRLSQVRLPGIQRYSQALREATERLNKLNLTDLSTSIEVPDIGLRHELGDIISLTLPMGIVAKPFRVVDPVMVQHGRWRLAVQEHDPAAYSDLVQAAPSLPNTSLNNPAGPPDAVGALTLEVVLGGLRITRTPSTELDIEYSEYQYSLDGGSTWLPIKDPADRQGCVWSTPPLGTVRVRARDVDSQGLAGGWSPVAMVTLTEAALTAMLAFGQNLIPNSDQSAAITTTLYIEPGTNIDGGVLKYASDVWSTGYTLRGGSTRNLFVRQVGRRNGVDDNNLLAATFQPAGPWDMTGSVPVLPGQRICSSAYMVAHRCFVGAGAQFFDASGNYISGSHSESGVLSAADAAAEALSQYTRIFRLFTAPAGAAYIRPFFRKYNTWAGQSDSYCWIAAPQVEVIGSEATGPSPYRAGPASSTRQLGYSGDLDATRGATLGVDVSGQITAANAGSLISLGALLQLYSVRVAGPIGKSNIT